MSTHLPRRQSTAHLLHIGHEILGRGDVCRVCTEISGHRGPVMVPEGGIKHPEIPFHRHRFEAETSNKPSSLPLACEVCESQLFRPRGVQYVQVLGAGGDKNRNIIRGIFSPSEL